MFINLSKIYNHFDLLHDDLLNIPSFIKENGSYIMAVILPEGIKSENINIEYDDEENTLTVGFSYKERNVSYSKTATEIVPFDADINTLSARVDGKVLTIVVDIIEDAPFELGDSVDIEIKHKKE